MRLSASACSSRARARRPSACARSSSACLRASSALDRSARSLASDCAREESFTGDAPRLREAIIPPRKPALEALATGDCGGAEGSSSSVSVEVSDAASESSGFDAMIESMSASSAAASRMRAMRARFSSSKR